MTEREKEALLAECLEEYHRRRARGEALTPEDWRDRVGEYFGEFRQILATESAIDELIEPPARAEELPRSFGEYTLLGVLGRGAMGIVYEAVHRVLGRKVALKVLRAGFEGEPLALERFRREARACAQVRHDHIVTIHDAGQVEGQPYYSMDLLEGSSLADLIRADVPPPPHTLCRGLADVADALEALHVVGIVHRDVKPANIFVETSGRFVLADFGIARSAMAQTLTQTGQIVGTPLYMSPEQILGETGDMDGRSDVYGLGASLYEALAKRPPFKADDVSTVTKMIVSEQPKPLDESAPGVPSDCARIAMMAMEKRKEDRYETAAEMAADLRAFAEGRPVKGRPVSNLRRWLRRFRGPGIAALVAFLMVAGFLAWYLGRPGQLLVDSRPVAEILVDGVSIGMSPTRTEVTPGSHEVTVRLEGFAEETIAVEVGRGAPATCRFTLVIVDPDDSVALERLARALGVTLDSQPEPARSRGVAAAGPVRTLYPIGNVRVEDLEEWSAELADPMHDPDGTIRFLRGDEELARIAWPGGIGRVSGPIPAAARAALATGDRVRWGYFPVAGESVTTTFRIVPDQSAVRIAEVEAAAAEQPVIVLHHLRAQLYREAGLHLAAWREIRRAVAEFPESARARLAAIHTLDAMGLSDSSLREDALESFDALPAEAKRGVVDAADSE